MFPEIDWGEEVRKFLEKRVRELLKERILSEADEIREILRQGNRRTEFLC